MTIAEYLQSLELEQYLSIFQENDIDFETLKELSDGDLKELGITSFGHRKKILGKLSTNSPAPAPTPAPAPAPAPVSKPAESNEQILLNENGVFISTHRIELAETTYPLGNISSVKIEIQHITGDVAMFIDWLKNKQNETRVRTLIPKDIIAITRGKMNILGEVLDQIPMSELVKYVDEYTLEFESYKETYLENKFQKIQQFCYLLGALMALFGIMFLFIDDPDTPPAILYFMGAVVSPFIPFMIKMGQTAEILKPTYSIKLGTAGGDVDGRTSTDLALVRMITEKIKEALTLRSS